MKIEITSIPNVIPETIDEAKQVLAENIIQNVYPLFNEVYQSKIDGIENLKKELSSKKELVIKEKDELQTIMDTYKRKKKVTKLLDRVEKLVVSGLAYDGALKHETIVLLKIADKLEEDKLDYHLHATLQTISKRFSR
jgi:hypothetical protein